MADRPKLSELKHLYFPPVLDPFELCVKANLKKNFSYKFNLRFISFISSENLKTLETSFRELEALTCYVTEFRCTIVV